MSLILEALRKSEAERRRGAAPGLHVELPPAPPPRRGAPAWALAGGAAAGLALVALVLLWPRDHAPGGPAGAPVAPGAPALADAATRGGPPDDDAYAGATAPAPAAYPPVERIRPVPVAVDDAGPLALPPPAARAAEEAARADAAGTPGAMPPPPAAQAPATATPARPASAVVPALPPASTPAPAPPAPAPMADGAIRVAGLSAAQRDRLPPLKLTLHMWNEDPARRFAVIDGQRRVEGDRVGDALVTAIDREGVLLDLDGQAVRVPLP